MAEPITPPDLVSAGVAQQSQPTEPMPRTTLPQDTISLLRPQPPQGMGDGDGASLMRALMAPQPAPNLGLAAAAGALQYAPGGPGGENSYLAGHERQMNEDYRRRADMVGFADRFQQRAQAKQERENAYLKEMSADLLKSDDPNANAVGAKGLSQYYATILPNQKPLPPQYFLQTAQLGKDEVDQINTELFAGLTPDQIRARHPKLSRMSPQWLEAQDAIVRNPAIFKKMGGQTPEEIEAGKQRLRTELAENEQKEWQANVPDIGKDQLPLVAQYIRSKTGGKLQGVDMSTSQGRALIAGGLQYANNEIEAQKDRDQRRKAKSEATTPKLSDASTFRGQFLAQTKDFVTVRDSYRRIGEAAKTPSAAGDLALIFNYMKLLDPGSVVRESEFATAAAAGGYGERLQAAAQRIVRGERLSEEMRRDFLAQSQGQFSAQRRGYLQSEEEFKRIAELSGMDPKTLPDLLGDLRREGPLAPQVRRIRVRDNKTGKLHDAELGPGDMIPPGYTEIK